MKQFAVRTAQDFTELKKFSESVYGVGTLTKFHVSGRKLANGSWVVGTPEVPLYSGAVPAVNTEICLISRTADTTTQACSTAEKVMCEFSYPSCGKLLNIIFVLYLSI